MVENSRGLVAVEPRESNFMFPSIHIISDWSSYLLKGLRENPKRALLHVPILNPIEVLVTHGISVNCTLRLHILSQAVNQLLSELFIRENSDLEFSARLNEAVRITLLRFLSKIHQLQATHPPLGIGNRLQRADLCNICV